MKPRGWPLPVKLVAVVAVPALFAGTLGVLRVLDESSAAADFDRVEHVATVQERYAALTVELQEERQAAVEFVALRDRDDPAPFEAAGGETDRAHEAAAAAAGDQSVLDAGPLGALRQVDNTYFRLTQLRRQVLTGANDATDLEAQYSDLVEPLLVFDQALTNQLARPDTSGLAQAVGALDEAREQVARQQSVITAALAAKSLSDAQLDALGAADARLATATATVRSVLTDEQQTRYAGFAGSSNTIRDRLKQSVVDRGRANLPLDATPQSWNSTSHAVLAEIDTAAAGARGELREVTAAAKEAASNKAGISSVLLLLAILLAAAVAYLVAKALINSLRTLRTAALDVADRKLPQAVQSMRDGAIPDIDVTPVPVTTREEVGQVARAFDAVHSQAVRLAAEQATLQANVSSMFANLSRRSQALAERQLKLIEELESNEQDPDQLANLFQLDSLATRMRRNSENLLVLSGTDLTKRASQPVPVVDVLRAAVSEVEQYQRVVVQSPPEATIAGRTASDIVHLLAELVDNATNFSPPDTQVVMSSQRTSDGTVLIEILDRGVGMSADEIDTANERLARPTALDVSVSRRMGLFVVGRLAARHGLGVRLGGGPGGTTASVTVPAYLVTAAPGAGLGGGATGGVRPTPSTPPGPPAGEFVPSLRGVNGVNGVNGANGQRPAPLSALVAGGDAPPGSPGGPMPGTPTRRPGTVPPATVNGLNGAPNGAGPDHGRNGSDPGRTAERPSPSAPSAPAAPSASGTSTASAPDLPVRRPGQMLGQIPPAAGTDRPGTLPQRTPRTPDAQPPGDLFDAPGDAAQQSGGFPARRQPGGRTEQSGSFLLPPGTAGPDAPEQGELRGRTPAGDTGRPAGPQAFTAVPRTDRPAAPSGPTPPSAPAGADRPGVPADPPARDGEGSGTQQARPSDPGKLPVRRPGEALTADGPARPGPRPSPARPDGPGDEGSAPGADTTPATEAFQAQRPDDRAPRPGPGRAAALWEARSGTDTPAGAPASGTDRDDPAERTGTGPASGSSGTTSRPGADRVDGPRPAATPGGTGTGAAERPGPASPGEPTSAEPRPTPDRPSGPQQDDDAPAHALRPGPRPDEGRPAFPAFPGTQRPRPGSEDSRPGLPARQPRPGSEESQPRLPAAQRPQPAPEESQPRLPAAQQPQPGRPGSDESRPRPLAAQQPGRPGPEDSQSGLPVRQPRPRPDESSARPPAAQRPQPESEKSQPGLPVRQPRPGPRPTGPASRGPGLPAPQGPARPAQADEDRPAAATGRPEAPRTGQGTDGSRGPAGPPPFVGTAPPRTNDPSETTPIFEEIASAWFRDDRAGAGAPSGQPGRQAPPAPPSPAAPQAGQAAAPGQTGKPQGQGQGQGQPGQAGRSEAAAAPLPTRGATPRPVPRPFPARPASPAGSTSPAPSTSSTPSTSPAGSTSPAPSGASGASAGPAAPAAPAASAAAAQAPAAQQASSATDGSAATFATAADDGWRASAAAAEARPEELTPAGLPKRRPRARLVPGAAGSTGTQQQPAVGQAGPAGAEPSAATRTAEAIRGRLSSYQDGVRQGREARMRRAAAAAEAARATASSATGGTGRREEERP